jgi:hypothetical protein
MKDKRYLLALCAFLLTFGPSASPRAEPVAYTNEAAFISAVEAQGYVWVLEGFEDDEVWGNVRTTISGGSYTAPAITNFRVRFSSNTNSSGITCSHGAALNGQWGAYSSPHGSFATGVGCDVPGNCGDGLLIAGGQPLYCFSVWVTGTYGGKLDVILNGDRMNPVRFPEVCDPFGENCIDYGLLSSGYKFFGVIDPAGFTQFELREMEGTAEDQKFIWCDEFRIAFSNPPPPRIRSITSGNEEVILGFKELAIPAQYTLERALTLVSNNWDAVDNFMASSTENNLTSIVSNEWNHAYFRLRSP